MTFNKTLLTATMLTLGGFAVMSANADDTRACHQLAEIF